MNQALVTVALPFQSEHVKNVKEVLDRLGNPAADAPRQALNKTGVVHFMSLSVVPDTARGQAHMMLELSADGGPAEALTAVRKAVGSTIATALDAAAIDRGGEDVSTFLLRRNQRLGAGWRRTTGLGFSGVPFMSVWRILAEKKLADDIAEMPVVWDATKSAFERLEEVREDLWKRDEKWAFAGEPAPFLQQGMKRNNWRDARMLSIVLAKLFWPLILVPLLLLWWWLGFGLALLFCLFGVVAGLGAAIWYLRPLEKADPVDDKAPNGERVEDIMRTENTGAQSLLSAVTVMKVGRFAAYCCASPWGSFRKASRVCSVPASLVTLGLSTLPGGR